MKFTFILTILFYSFVGQTIDKKTYYDTLGSDSLEALNKMMVQVEQEKSSSLNNAYKGVLIAKKASFTKNAVEKLKSFKEGVRMLEQEIKLHPNLVELRFLRLTLQENTPKILNYKDNINEDVKAISQGYAKLGKDLKSIIGKYAKKSTVLTSDKLN
jgi:hypothetical protein